jgi:prepilin-type N-terminal cleavage/methylation domain-containing protein
MQAKRTARRFGPRGLTLIELMTAAAISVVAVTVAASVFTALARTRRDAMRLVEIQAAGAISSSELQAQLVNAGYRFPAPAFAVNVRNAVTSLPPGSPAGGTGSVIDATTGCGTGGLAAGTDSVEIVTGRPDIFPGKVAAVDSFPPASPTTDHNIVLETFMPFLTNENGVGVVLFADMTGESCIGRVYSGPQGSSPPNINVTMIDRDWNDVTSASTIYPNCPKVGMSVYRFWQRKRYFICAEPNQPDGGGGTSSSLFRQDSLADPVGFSYLTPPNKIQDGLEDLQVSPRVFARAPVMVGPDCTPAVGGGEGFCFCDFSPNSACKLATGDINAPKVTKAAWVSWVSGLRVSVGAIGTRPMATDIPDGGKPQIMDHVVTGTSDGLRRVTMDVSLGLPNIVQVLP